MKYLLVPMQIDALYIPAGGKSVAEQEGDFSALPFFDSKQKLDIHSDTPNIGEAIMSKVFNNQNLHLNQGIHLHWALPDALTRGMHRAEGIEFPEIPNRWLVTRYRKEKEKKDAWTVDKESIIESDFLFPEHEDKKGIAAAIPYPPSTSGQPYRFMGRKLSLSRWREEKQAGKENEYFMGNRFYGGNPTEKKGLTVMGYGNPEFSSFYPNCFSVLGFSDKVPQADLGNFKYEVIGWYENRQDSDELFRWIQKATQKKLKDSLFEEQFLDRFHWHLNESDKKNIKSLGGLICHASISFTSKLDTRFERDFGPVDVTIANSATEGLSARMAHWLASLKNQGSSKEFEDQLEAMQHAVELTSQELDTEFRLEQFRHEKEFVPESGGILWTVEQNSPDQVNGAGSLQTGKGAEHLRRIFLGNNPDEKTSVPAGLLQELNHLQNQYNQYCAEIKDMRRQLFADWYKYMICVYPPDTTHVRYPDIDLVKGFVEYKVVKPLEEKIAASTNLHNRLAQTKQELETAIATINESDIEVKFALKSMVAPRFWEPHEPVILINGDIASPTRRHGQDGTLSCRTVELKGGEPEKSFFETIRKALKNIDSFRWQQQPWNPFALEWHVQFLPVVSRSYLHESTGIYDEKFILDNFELPSDSHDLQLKHEHGEWIGHGKFYHGRSYLSPNTIPILRRQICDLLKQHDLLTQILSKKDQGEDLENVLGSETKIKRIIQNYQKKHGDDTIVNYLRVYQQLGKMKVLSQALGGFNDSLLMYKKTIELSIDDPLAFDPYKLFTNQTINSLMGDSTKIAPAPLNRFHPIRAGYLKMINLRLIDTFGQVQSLPLDKIFTTSKMRCPNSRFLVQLLPRIIQPLRLHFRLLDAVAPTNDRESGSHESSGPICGWLITNKLNRTLVCFDNRGNALGEFVPKQGWQPAPGKTGVQEPMRIPNPHLNRMAVHIHDLITKDLPNGASNTFLEDFIHTIDDALANIQPETNSDPQGISLLMGRPIALVRTLVDLQVKGPLAVNQSWTAFNKDLNKSHRTTDQFESVQFPIRLGEYGMLNDGLVGYWLEEKGNDGKIRYVGGDKSKFYALQSDYRDTASIESSSAEISAKPISFNQSISSPPQYVSMLVDVQGHVHATTGILPKKSITIPAKYYSQSLANIAITFLPMPILTPEEQIHLPVSRDPQFTWSWLEAQAHNGHKVIAETPLEGIVLRQIFIDRWSEQMAASTLNGQTIFDELVLKKWLVPQDEHFEINTENRLELNDNFKSLTSRIKQILDEAQIVIRPVITRAAFTGRQHIREGRLKVSGIQRKEKE